MTVRRGFALGTTHRLGGQPESFIVLNAVQQLGGTIGVAVSGTLFFELLADGPLRAMEITTVAAAAFLAGAQALVRLLPWRQRLDQAGH